jgi:hypothetical protein
MFGRDGWIPHAVAVITVSISDSKKIFCADSGDCGQRPANALPNPFPRA